MTKVNDKREQQRAEQARAEKRVQCKSRQQSDDFARLVGQKQKPAVEKKSRLKRQHNRESAQPSARGGQRADNALLARQGIQAHPFQHFVAQKGKEDPRHARDEVTHSSANAQETRDGMDLNPQDRIAAVNRDEQGESQTGDGGLGSDAQNDHQDSNSAGSPPPSSVNEVAAGSSPSAPVAGAPRSKLPAAVIEKIVKQVAVGVNPAGMSEVHIDFQGSGLDGTSIVLTSKGSKIYARVFTDNRNLGRLFKASHTELARALRKGANLSLEELEVMGTA